MKIDFEGKTWDVDAQAITLAQAVVITGRLGCSLSGWDKALADPESAQWLEAMRCLYWLMVQQDDQEVPLGSVDFEVLRFAEAMAAAIERDTAAEVVAAAEAIADPTTRAEPPAVAESGPQATSG